MDNKILLILIIVVLILLEFLTYFSIYVCADDSTVGCQARDSSTIELQVDHIKQDVAPNLTGTKAKVEYNIMIWNRGLVWDMFDITEVNNHGFVVEIDPTITNKIDPDESTEVIVEITIDNKAPMTVIDYETTVTVTSRYNNSISESVTLKTQILQAYGVELQPFETMLKTGDTLTGDYRKVEFQVDVKNIGTGEDTFKLEFDGDYSDWATLNDSSEILLSSKDVKTVTIIVKVPRETEIGDIPIDFRAISQGDDTQYEYETDDAYDEATLTVEVTQFYEITLTVPGGSVTQSGLPGDTIDFTITVANSGNGEDKVRLQKKDYDLNWDWILSSSRFTLMGAGDSTGSTRDITLSVDIPTDKYCESGIYFISIYVDSDTPDGIIKHNNNDPLILSVKVNKQFDVDLELEYPTSSEDQKVDPGKNITYELTLKNRGNSNDTVNLKAQGEKSEWVEFTNTKINLTPFGFSKFDAILEIPELTDENMLALEAKKYEILITATSENDPDASAEVTLEPEINPIYKTEMETDLPRDVTGNGIIIMDPNVEPGYSSFELTIKNCGNSVDHVTITTTGSDEWVLKYVYENSNTETISFPIYPGVVKTVSVHVHAPADARDGEAELITINARSENDKITSNVILKAMVKTAVIRFKEIEVSDKTAGSKTTVKMTVMNVGTVDAEDVDIRFFDNGILIHTEKIERIKVNESVEIKFDYELEDGDHQLVARTDRSDGTIKKETTFTTENVDISSTFTLLIVISVLIIIIITLVLALLLVAKRKRLEEESQIPAQPRRVNPNIFTAEKNISNKDIKMPPERLKPY